MEAGKKYHIYIRRLGEHMKNMEYLETIPAGVHPTVATVKRCYFEGKEKDMRDSKYLSGILRPSKFDRLVFRKPNGHHTVFPDSCAFAFSEVEEDCRNNERDDL